MREALDRWKGRNGGSCGYGLWCRVFAAERSTNNGKKYKRGGERGRLMTAGDSQRGSETRVYEKLKKKEEEEGVSGISRARHPRMNRQFRNNGKVAICRPFVFSIPSFFPP